jgi:hypothetical protein
MQQDDIQTLRERAERAVADMPEGDLKIKAFEVILTHLLGKATQSSAVRPDSIRLSTRDALGTVTSASSCTSRTLVLKTEGFFMQQRTLGEVRTELAQHGWHYSLGALSGKLQVLVQRRELRRVKVDDGRRTVWKYSEP